MKVCEACLTAGCAMCNWNGVVGDDKINSRYFNASEAAKAQYHAEMEGLKHLYKTEGITEIEFENMTRTEMMKSMKESGMCNAEIAHEFGVSERCVRSYLPKN